MKKPNKPKKPRKPSKEYTHTLSLDVSSYKKIEEVINDFKTKINTFTPKTPFDLSKIEIREIDRRCYECGVPSMRFEYISILEKEPEVYQQDLQNYKSKLSNYKEKYDIFKKDMEKYIQHIEEEDIKKKKKLFKELKEELEKEVIDRKGLIKN